MTSLVGRLCTEVLPFDGGRSVTLYLPQHPTSVVYAADGAGTAAYATALENAGWESTAIVGVHGLTDETARLEEYSPGFDPKRFAAHEEFFVEVVPRWARESFELDLDLEPARTAVFGASAGGELALAVGIRNLGRYGAILCGSPGAGYRPTPGLAGPLPRVCIVAGRREPFFLENATRWADALRDAEVDLEFRETDGEHGIEQWVSAFPGMVRWAFAR